MNKMWSSALALAAGFGFAAPFALAQSADDAVQTEEIVVTVQLREQNITDVPIAVTAYGQDFLDRLGATQYDQLALFVPGFEVQEQSANNTGFVIRGITSDSGSAISEPRIAVFQDGVSTSRNRGTYQELFDIERIEVARGPQATLFGRGALIGAVNVIQNKADTEEFSGTLELGGGDNGYARGMGVVNIPIAEDQFAIRLGATRREQDGFTANTFGGDDLGGQQVTAYRIASAWTPSETLRFDLLLNQHEDDNAGTSFKSGTFNAIGGDTSPFSAASLNRTAPGFEGGREIGLDRRLRAGTLIANWQASEALTLTSITGYREFESIEAFDPDGSAIPLIQAAEDAEGEQWSQEIRLAYDNGGPLSGFVGVSFFHEEGSQRAPTQYDERYALAFSTGDLPGPSTPSLDEVNAINAATLTGLLAPLLPLLKPAHREQSTNLGETDAIDVFADATWRVTERFELTAGVRYTSDDKTSTLVAETLNGPSVLGGLLLAQGLLGEGDFGGALAVINALTSPSTADDPQVGLFTQPQTRVSASDSFDGFTYRLVGRYAVSDDVSLWASYARGRTPNVISITPGNLPGSETSFETLPDETVDSFEVGVRASRLMNGALDVEGSIYRYQYNDFQSTTFDAGRIVPINAGEATATGFETAARWLASEQFELFATYAYSHARFEGGARDGNRFRLSPDHSLSLGFTWEIPVGDLGDFSLTPTYTWQSKVFFDDNNDRLDLQPPPLPGLQDAGVDEVQESYGLFNLRARFDAASRAWAITAFANNIADEDYLLDAGNVGDSFTIPTFIRGEGRTIGAELALKF